MRIVFVASLALFAACARADHGNAQTGKEKALAACASCHGPAGDSRNPEWPRLAGQHAVYLVNQLRAFRSGERHNALMSPQATALSDEDMHDLAAYFAGQVIR